MIYLIKTMSMSQRIFHRAEGDERDTNKESVRFLYIAKGSLGELLTQIIISKEIGYLQDEQFDYVFKECEMIGKMLGKLIKARSYKKPITHDP